MRVFYWPIGIAQHQIGTEIGNFTVDKRMPNKCTRKKMKACPQSTYT